MRALTTQEQRTIRLGAIAIAGYLAIFGGLRIRSLLQRQAADYQKLMTEAQGLRTEIQRYEAKAAAAKSLMERFNLDPAGISRTTVVAEASAAIQKAAASGGIQVGPVRESLSRSVGKELASVQLEGIGPVPAWTTFLGRIDSLGYPLLVDTIQITPENSKPGQVKMNLTIIVLDFVQPGRSAKEAPHA
jgi:hypothetical protein